MENESDQQSSHDHVEVDFAGIFGCMHYRRRCKIRSPCCNEIFDCRHCHNEAKNSPQVNPDDRHKIPRQEIKKVICSICKTEQDVQQNCKNCGVCMGKYFCEKCNLFDDDVSKEQYHCEDCGICRTGGRENYFHCKICGCCLTISLKDSHPCMERASHQNCPVCFELLFESMKPFFALRCGHLVHAACFRRWSRHHSSVCPVCTQPVQAHPKDSNNNKPVQVPATNSSSNQDEDQNESPIMSPMHTDMGAESDDSSGGSVTREITEWTFVLASLILEGCSAVLEQLATEKKPQYTIAGMWMAFVGFLICIVDLVLKVRRENVSWERRGIVCWFYYPAPNHFKPFGSVVDMFGLACSTWGSVSSTVAYVCFHLHLNNPIKLSPLPFIFVLSVAISGLIKSLTRAPPHLD